MRHKKSSQFQLGYDALPEGVQRQADKAFALLKADPNHPSLRLKKVGKYWSARAGLQYRAVAVTRPYGLLWIWIGPHGAYDRFIGG